KPMKLAIYGQYYKDNTEEIIDKVLCIFEPHGPEIAFEADFYNMLSEKGSLEKPFKVFACDEDVDEGVDMLISIGGDGTMLRAATFVRDKNIPLLGINAGRLGFLATVQQEDIDKLLPLIFENKYKISPRSLLTLDYEGRDKELDGLDYALNEV